MFDYTNNKKIIGTNTKPQYMHYIIIIITEVLFLLPVHISILG